MTLLGCVRVHAFKSTCVAAPLAAGDTAAYTGVHCERKYKAWRERREREEGLQLVIPEQLLRPAFSVLLGENNSIKGTRGSIITEWGNRRQLPAWL